MNRHRWETNKQTEILRDKKKKRPIQRPNQRTCVPGPRGEQPPPRATLPAGDGDVGMHRGPDREVRARVASERVRHQGSPLASASQHRRKSFWVQREGHSQRRRDPRGVAVGCRSHGGARVRKEGGPGDRLGWGRARLAGCAPPFQPAPEAERGCARVWGGR